VNRRAFITLIGGAIVASPLAARAQQADRMRRIGVLTNFAEGNPEAQTWATAFQEELQRLGWGHGRNIWIVYRWAGDRQDRLPTYAVELVGMAQDVIVAAGSP
jgi:putative tryptophan/tyrosine transport system substrate-binding protein